MLTLHDAYEILEITPDADIETAKTAFRKRAKETHPDHFLSEPEDVQQEKSQEFQRIVEAFEKIKDEHHPNRQKSNFGQGFSDFNFDDDPFSDHSFGRDADDEAFYSRVISAALQTKEGARIFARIDDVISDISKYNKRALLSAKLTLASGSLTASSIFAASATQGSSFQTVFAIASTASIAALATTSFTAIYMKRQAEKLDFEYIRLEEQLYTLGFEQYSNNKQPSPDADPAPIQALR